jgi:hypothetical protein
VIFSLYDIKIMMGLFYLSFFFFFSFFFWVFEANGKGDFPVFSLI